MIMPATLNNFTRARRNLFRGGGWVEVHQGRAYKGFPGRGSGGNSPGRLRGFQRFSKSNKKLQFLGEIFQFLINFHENFAIFSKDFWKFTRIVRENFSKYLEKVRSCICPGFGWRSPEGSKFIKKTRRKSNGNRQFFENILKLWENFLFVEANKFR